MAVTARLDIRQGQTLVMTPQLQQAIKLLQLSNLDLAAYVEAELEKNPLLVREDAREDAGQPKARDNDDAGPASAQDTADLTASENYAPTGDTPLDTDYENDWQQEAGDGGAPAPDAGAAYEASYTGGALPSSGGGWDPDMPGLDQTIEDTTNLRDHLHEQLRMEFEAPADLLIGRRLIDLVDESGYLSSDPMVLADTLGADPALIKAVLARMQRFDPAGVFARDLGECLAIQLRELDRLDPAMECLLAHLDLVARRDTRALMRECGVDAEDIDDMIDEIRALDPKPGLTFDAPVSQPIVPDVLMRARAQKSADGPAEEGAAILRKDEAETGAGAWSLELNPDTLPRVLIDKSYYAEVSGAARRDEDKEYISECMATANWLVKSLHQRATTIIKVATEIVRQQQAFFEHGVEFLRPIILRDIADAVDMHESTISRVTSNKYIATPRGIFELKYFFTTAISGRDGSDARSAESVRHRIRALVDEEPADRILSDDRLVDILQGEGIDIARRTVAKYRDSMRIPSSVQRRREKALRA